MNLNLLRALVYVAFVAGPVAAQTPIVTVNPIVLADKTQGKELSVRVTAPVSGDKLPVILFSHGAQYSKDDYLPLTEFWASHGYVVLQPTHIESKTYNLARDDQRVQDAWRTRALDLRHVLDELDKIETTVPGLKGRIDRSKVVTAGHSFGGHTASLLVGARVTDPALSSGDLSDARVSAAVLLAPPGYGSGLRTVSWADMKKPTLTIVGDQDFDARQGGKWEAHADPYTNAPAGNACLGVLAGMKHYLGGTLGTNRTEEQTPSPEALAEIQRISLAFFDTWSKGAKDWPEARAALLAKAPAVYRSFECK